MPSEAVPGDEWTEVVGRDLEGDYTVVVEDAPIYLSPGSAPTREVAGIPVRAGTLQSITLDRTERLHARSQTDVDASVRVVPGLTIEGSNERNVAVQTNVDSGRYDRGDSFSANGSADYPVSVDPAETVKSILFPIVDGEFTLKLTTADGNVVSFPIDTRSTVSDYRIDSFELRDSTGNGPRVEGGWAGE